MSKKKLLFVLPNFSLIGAQKMCKLFIDTIDKSNYEVIIVSYAHGGYFESEFMANKMYNLRPNNTILTKLFKLFLPLLCIWKLSKIIRNEKPKVCISIAPYTNFVLLFASKLLLRFKPIIIIEEHQHLTTSKKSDPESHLSIMNFLYKYFFFLYNKANVLKVVSESSKKDFIDNWKIRPEIVKVVNPPTHLEEIIEELEQEPETRFFEIYKPGSDLIISLGRLEAQKDFSFLIDSFYLAHQQNPNLRLIIFGNGSKKDDLQNKINGLKLDKVAFLFGFIKNPYPLYKFAKAFCLTSVWEGMPVVILEAMACKVPVISVPCPSGPDEMIIDNETGLLVAKDKEIFSRAIELIINNQDLRKKITNNAYNSLNRWSLETYKNNFNKLLNEIE